VRKLVTGTEGYIGSPIPSPDRTGSRSRPHRQMLLWDETFVQTQSARMSNPLRGHSLRNGWRDGAEAATS